MFVFIIPRTPLKKQNIVRESLWNLCVKSLIIQKSKNWKAIVIGRNDLSINDHRFIFLEHDEIDKHAKIDYAINHIKQNLSKDAKYLIRLDDDDIISPNILNQIEKLGANYDCFYDEFHNYIDLAYLKISKKKNNWMANTVVHSIENALLKCGPKNIILINQDHSAYWHIHYKNKKSYCFKKNNPIYYRILTPFSVTSLISQSKAETDWKNYLKYLKGYGPWILLSKSLVYKNDLKKISSEHFKSIPKLPFSHWIINYLKYKIEHK
jgi:hypothetical protein